MQIPRLRHYRQKAFLSQGELAEKSGVHVSTIKRLEDGTTEARYSTIRKLAEALSIAPDALVEPVPEQGRMTV